MVNCQQNLLDQTTIELLEIPVYWNIWTGIGDRRWSFFIRGPFPFRLILLLLLLTNIILHFFYISLCKTWIPSLSRKIPLFIFYQNHGVLLFLECVFRPFCGLPTEWTSFNSQTKSLYFFFVCYFGTLRQPDLHTLQVQFNHNPQKKTTHKILLNSTRIPFVLFKSMCLITYRIENFFTAEIYGLKCTRNELFRLEIKQFHSPAKFSWHNKVKIH